MRSEISFEPAARDAQPKEDHVNSPPAGIKPTRVEGEPHRRARRRFGKILVVAVLGLIGMAGARPCQRWTSRDEPYPIGTVLTAYTNTENNRYELKQVLSDGRMRPDAPSLAWASTQRRCTDLDAHGFPVTFDQRLRRFSIWTNRTLNLNDRVQLRPWWFGSSHGPVNLGAYSDILGNLRVGGDLNRRSFNKLWGEAWRSGHYTSQSPGGIDAVVYKPSITDLVVSLPDRVFAGGTDQIAHPDQMLDLAPGSYGAVTVNSRATLVLHGGEYEITRLTLEPQAKVRVVWDTAHDSVDGSTPGLVALRVHVRDEIWCKQEVKFDLQNGNASDMLWMVHGTGGVFVGSAISANTSQKAGVGFHGTVIAPKSKVEIASDGVLTGTLYADELEVHQANRFLTFVPFDNDPRTMDSDGDGLADSSELRIGTDPNDLDTDEDGLSDALEYQGRGVEADGITQAHRFGAELAMQVCREAWNDSAAATHPCHRIDGYIPSLDAMDRLHPARRDLALRLFWEPDSVIDRPGNFNHFKTYDDLIDSFLMHSMAASFANDSNYRAIPDSDVVRVSILRVALHVDAGNGARTVNYPSEVERFGGARLVASGGTDSWEGLWNYDTASKGPWPDTVTAMPQSISLWEAGQVLKKMSSSTSFSRSFWDMFHCGFLVVMNEQSGFGIANQSYVDAAKVMEGSYFLVGGNTPYPKGIPLVVMHEFGHNLGLMHHQGKSANAWLYEGVMNYAYPYSLGCTPDKWDPVTGKGSVGNKRWCGEVPSKDIVPAGFPQSGQEWYRACDPNSWYWLRDSTAKQIWTCDGLPKDYGNRAPIASDLPVRAGEGPLDLTTGYRTRYPLYTGPFASDFRYSRGNLCHQNLMYLNEKEGLSVCMERGVQIEQKSFGPIDFNGNGVIDEDPVNLLSDEHVRLKWFWKDVQGVQQDYDNWNALSFSPRRTSPLQNSGRRNVLGVSCRKSTMFEDVTVSTCQD